MMISWIRWWRPTPLAVEIDDSESASDEDSDEDSDSDKKEGKDDGRCRAV
jgi:hypothetical protein